ncbi:ABC transporter ATP-binding protein [Corynebacterium diphtheriae]|nr:ABC transporter ATP-binding protein [Corynebacterium diphtheriae]
MSRNHVKITKRANTPKTARVVQVSGIFDLPLEAKQTREWDHYLPIEEKTWQVGLIVGPSGAGKSVLANELWPGKVREGYEWDERSIVDNFDNSLDINQITGALTAVGLASVPTWVRPYSTLSNGEKFRADMARTITETEGLAVVDEFTSVVDRQVAKVTSHCVQKSVRRGTSKFVAVTCHYDVEDWLQPDWVYDVASQEFRWRSVQPRPQLTLNIREAKRSEWTLFAHHHYMSPILASSAKCFIAEIDGKPVAWTSYIHFMHPRTKNIKMAHRTVVLPDYQGLGIAGALADWQGQRLYEMGYRYRQVLAHPAMVRIAQKSPRWRQTAAPAKRVATSAKSQNKKSNMSARRLMLHNFEYVPPVGTKNPRRKPMDRAPKKKVKRPTRK